MKKIFLLAIIAFLLSSASFVFAADPGTPSDCTEGAGSLYNANPKCYQKLSPITDATGKEPDVSTFPKYLDSMYRIGIGACFALGVIMFTWAGIEYILSESVTKKSRVDRTGYSPDLIHPPTDNKS